MDKTRWNWPGGRHTDILFTVFLTSISKNAAVLKRAQAKYFFSKFCFEALDEHPLMDNFYCSAAGGNEENCDVCILMPNANTTVADLPTQLLSV